MEAHLELVSGAVFHVDARLFGLERSMCCAGHHVAAPTTFKVIVGAGEPGIAGLTFLVGTFVEGPLLVTGLVFDQVCTAALCNFIAALVYAVLAAVFPFKFD